MSIEFFYETRYVNKLDKKLVKVDCYDFDRVGANDFIGTVSIDLHTLATGPVFHDCLMRDVSLTAVLGRVFSYL